MMGIGTYHGSKVVAHIMTRLYQSIAQQFISFNIGKAQWIVQCVLTLHVLHVNNFVFISYLNKAEKKRKGKTVTTTPWSDQPRLFSDQQAAPGDRFGLLLINLYYSKYIFCILSKYSVFKEKVFFLRKNARRNTMVNWQKFSLC